MPTVSDDDFRAYVDRFHLVYRETVDSCVSPSDRESLGRWRYIDAPLRFYLSTMNGVGFEYAPGGSSDYVKGSAPVEELFVRDAPRRLRTGPAAFALNDAANVAIEGLTIIGVLPARLRGRSSLRLVEIAIKASTTGGYRRQVAFAELHSTRDAEYWSEAEAVARAKDEVYTHALDLANARRLEVDLDDYLTEVRQQMVLVLGDYSEEGATRLEAIRAELRRLGYRPVLINELADLADQDLRQKVHLYALAARFTVIDDSSRAGQLTELPIVQASGAVAIVIRQTGSWSSFMTREAGARSSVIFETDYELETLRDTLGAAVRWAEETIGRLVERLNASYPWRRQAGMQ